MASPCTNDPNEVISAVVGIQTAEENFERALDDAVDTATENADKFDAFVNGTDTQTVQLGEGAATPTIRNTVRQMMSAASALPSADVSGKSSTSNGGVIMRTLAERFSDVINVKDFGAKGDGVTDDTTAIQAAFQAAYDRGGATVFAPEGIYKLTNHLFLGSNTTFISDKNTTYLRSSDVNVLWLSLGLGVPQNERDSYNSFQNVKIIGGTWEMNSLEYTNDNEAFCMTHCTGLLIDGVRIRDIRRNHAIEIAGCKDVKITNCRFEGFSNISYQESDANDRFYAEAIQLDENNSTIGIYGGTASGLPNTNVEISSCYFGSNPDNESEEFGSWGCGVGGHGYFKGRWQNDIRIHDNIFESNGRHAIRVKKWKSVVISNNMFDGGPADGAPIVIEPYWADVEDAQANTESWEEIVVSNNTFKDVPYFGINIAQVNYTLYGYPFRRGKNVVIANNVLQAKQDNTTGNAITVFGAEGCVVSGNVVSGFNIGVYVNDSNNVNITNNSLTNVNGNCIQSQGDTTGVTISSNLLQSDTGNGIRVTANTNKFGIFNNNVISCGAIGVYTNGACSNGLITGNRAVTSSTTYSGIRVESGCSNVIVGINHGESATGVELANSSTGYQLTSLGPSKITNKGYNYTPALFFSGFDNTGQISWASNKHLRFGLWDESNNTFTLLNSLNNAGTFFPNSNTSLLGLSNKPWGQLYASTGTIGSSDERLKDNIQDIDASILRAWGDVRLKLFQFKDAIEAKGSNARIHAGAIAQQIKEAFANHGIDANRFGLFCYDEWQDEYEDIVILDSPAQYDEEGVEISPEQTHTEKRLVTKAGNKYSLRYTECLILEAAYQRWLGEQRDARIAELEARLNEISGNSPAPSGAE